MMRVLGLSVVLLLCGVACGDDDGEPPNDCDSATSCGGTGGSKPAGGAGHSGAGPEMDSGVDSSTPLPDSGPDAEFDGGEDDAGQ